MYTRCRFYNSQSCSSEALASTTPASFPYSRWNILNHFCRWQLALFKTISTLVFFLLRRGFSAFVSSVVNPWHFGTDQGPWIRTTDLRIRIQIRRILLFSSVAFKMATKLFLLISFQRYIYNQSSQIKSHK